MKLLHPISILFAAIINLNGVFAQEFVIKDVKSFGAKGDGKTNDQDAFEKAATYFNERGGNGKLTISKGIYIVGKQNFTGGQPGKPAYEGEDVLHFTNVQNLKIEGTGNTILRYEDSLRFGAFTPSGMAYEHGKNFFAKNNYAALIGSCIYFDKCKNVSVTNITLDGNNKGIVLGGIYGDVGRQLPHFGVYIKNSNYVTVDKLNAHHFGLDGICIANKVNGQKDSISVINSSFEYNARQGLSWVGGNNLEVKNCKFTNTGKGAFSSAPGAGVDIEPEAGPVKNGYFTNCEFTNNTGVGLVADRGDAGDCTFTGCTFWGATNWSIWVTRPGFAFNKCNIYGSIVHGYDSPDEEKATRFTNCNFEDKPYEGKDPYGNFLVESNGAKRVSFSDCTFTSNNKKLFWITNASVNPEEKYQFTNCRFFVKHANFRQGEYVGLMRGMRLKNCTFEFQDPAAKSKKYTLLGYSEKSNVDLGGNKIVYSAEK